MSGLHIMISDSSEEFFLGLALKLILERLFG